MTKSELIERIVQKQPQLAHRDVELAVKTILDYMSEQLAGGRRIEIRGFGSFSLHYRRGRVGRNPKTGAPVSLPTKHVPHFKPGKKLRECVNGRRVPDLEPDGGEGSDADPSLAPPHSAVPPFPE